MGEGNLSLFLDFLLIDNLEKYKNYSVYE